MQAEAISARPPAHLRWLYDLIGLSATFALLERRAGTRVYIPHRNKNSWVERELGPKAAEMLCRSRGGEHFDLPLAKAWRAEVYRTRGMKIDDIARRLGLTDRVVRRYLMHAGLTDPAASLDTTAQRWHNPASAPAKARRKCPPGQLHLGLDPALPTT